MPAWIDLLSLAQRRRLLARLVKFLSNGCLLDDLTEDVVICLQETLGIEPSHNKESFYEINFESAKEFVNLIELAIFKKITGGSEASSAEFYGEVCQSFISHAPLLVIRAAGLLENKLRSEFSDYEAYRERAARLLNVEFISDAERLNVLGQLGSFSLNGVP